MLVGRGTGVGQGRVKGLLGSGASGEVLERQGLVEVAVNEGLGDYLLNIGGTGLGYLTAWGSGDTPPPTTPTAASSS